jgi:proline iminopeptidase
MKNNILLLSVFSSVLLLNACVQQEKNALTGLYFEKTADSIQTGGVQMIAVSTPKGKFNVWTKRFGNNPGKKLLLLNGGPGATHEYFECFENFLPKESIEFIYYDQLTCGNSDNPKDSSLFDLGRYVEEVEQVRQALHLDSSNFYLLGHSWGGILAMQYALKYQSHIKGLIISNMMASCPEYGKYANEVLAKQMRPAVLDSIKAIEKKGDFQNPAYMDLLKKNFYNEHIIRLAAWPEPMVRALSRTNNELYVTMQGPSEFGIAGKLANWDVSSELKNIQVPTLVIGATHDTMDPKYMKWMSKQIPGADFLLCPKGSHMSMYDDQQTYMDGLIKFINKAK